MRFIASLLKKTDNKVTVALSSGSDSIAIAHFLKQRYPSQNLRCFHFDHALRDQNTLMWQSAKTFCDDFGIEFISNARDVLNDEDVSEAGLRKIRYKAMVGLGYVITGHHLDDACENYLYNCFNGVPDYLPIPLETVYAGMDLTIIRPFIPTTKADINAYIGDNNLSKYVIEDETNKDEHCRRNWIRHNLMPQITDKGYNLKTIVRKRYERYLNEEI